jgi:hypothetical protein
VTKVPTSTDWIVNEQNGKPDDIIPLARGVLAGCTSWWKPLLAHVGRAMNEQVYEEAYVRVRRRYSNVDWKALSRKDIDDAIYREIQIITAKGSSRKPDEKAPEMDRRQ